MGWLMEIALGVCLIILVSGVVNVASTYASRAARRQAQEEKLGAGTVAERLAELERRLTDVQDVMIAVSEKLDRWEDAHRAEGRLPAGRGTHRDTQ